MSSVPSCGYSLSVSKSSWSVLREGILKGECATVCLYGIGNRSASEKREGLGLGGVVSGVAITVILSLSLLSDCVFKGESIPTRGVLFLIIDVSLSSIS